MGADQAGLQRVFCVLEAAAAGQRVHLVLHCGEQPEMHAVAAQRNAGVSLQPSESQETFTNSPTPAPPAHLQLLVVV